VQGKGEKLEAGGKEQEVSGCSRQGAHSSRKSESRRAGKSRRRYLLGGNDAEAAETRWQPKLR
jgi:hypothetical protein